MGFLKRRRDEQAAMGVLDGMQSAAVNGLPLQRQILTAFGTDEIEWVQDGQHRRARPTGQLYGEQAPDFLLIGRARFVDSTTGEDIWEYPTMVLACSPRFVDPEHSMPSVAEIFGSVS